MSANLDTLIPEFQPYARDLRDIAGAAGLQPRITSTRRSNAEQKRLYDRYLAGLSGLPAAPPGQSAHEYGYAMDMVVTPYEALADLGRIWQEAGGVWGGQRDPVHFEYPGFKAEPYRDPVDKAVAEFIDSLPWYVSLAIPLPLMTITKGESAEFVIERVIRWIQENF